MYVEDLTFFMTNCIAVVSLALALSLLSREAGSKSRLNVDWLRRPICSTLKLPRSPVIL